MTANVLEEAGRVEVCCDGCGRVIVTRTTEEYESVKETPLRKVGGLEYCEVCAPNHEKRISNEKNSYENRHRHARETIGDPEELELVLKGLDEEYGINRENQNT